MEKLEHTEGRINQIAKLIQNSGEEGLAVTNPFLKTLGIPGGETATSIRNRLPFCCDWIVAEKTLQPGSRRESFVYKILSKEKYDNYQFSTKNFSTLEGVAIEDILSKIAPSVSKLDTETKYSFLYLCENLQECGAGLDFVKPRLRYLSSIMNIERNNLLLMLKKLEEVDLIELQEAPNGSYVPLVKGKWKGIKDFPVRQYARDRKEEFKIAWRAKIEDLDDSVRDALALLSTAFAEDKEKIKKLQEKVTLIETQEKDKKRISAEELATLKQEREHLENKVQVFRKELDNERNDKRRNIATIEALNQEIRRLTDELEKTKKNARLVKDFEDLPDKMLDRASIVMDSFFREIDKASEEFINTKNKVRFQRSIKYAKENLDHSVMNIVKVKDDD